MHSFVSMRIQLKTIKYLTPLLFWVFQLTIHIIRNIYLIAEHSLAYVMQSVFITYPLDIFTFCVFYFLFAPAFFARRYLTRNLLLAGLYIITYSFLWVLVYYLNGAAIPDLDVIYASSIGHSLLYAFYGVVIRLALDWFERREDKKEMEQQHIQTELALLRLQINPHFLFNTLNNINSFALTAPDKASFAIIKLSGIMRYMLYEAQAERVLLEKEIVYIEDYLALQKIRSAQPNLVNFYTSDIPENLLVPPMLFIPFIENAFKHGRKMGSAEISISLLFVEGALIFKCKNQKRVLNETEESEKKGIGIENIKRRLALLFPGKSTLEIQDLPDIFNVELKIKMG